MLQLQFPSPDFRIRTENGREWIYDILRKKWVALTPEEWVRQNMVQYLVKVLRYPATLVALEKEISVGELRKRFDILVYTQELRPWLMVECKAMEVALGEDTVHQLLRYNLGLPVRFLVITNGRECYVWEKKERTIMPKDGFPAFGS